MPNTRTSRTICERSRDNLTGVYFTDRGIEELAGRRGEDSLQNIGMPECSVSLCHAAAYLALAPKSVAVYVSAS